MRRTHAEKTGACARLFSFPHSFPLQLYLVLVLHRVGGGHVGDAGVQGGVDDLGEGERSESVREFFGGRWASRASAAQRVSRLFFSSPRPQQPSDTYTRAPGSDSGSGQPPGRLSGLKWTAGRRARSHQRRHRPPTQPRRPPGRPARRESRRGGAGTGRGRGLRGRWRPGRATREAVGEVWAASGARGGPQGRGERSWE